MLEEAFGSLVPTLGHVEGERRSFVYEKYRISCTIIWCKNCGEPLGFGVVFHGHPPMQLWDSEPIWPYCRCFDQTFDLIKEGIPDA